MYLDYDGSRRLAAAADEVLLQQGDFAHVSGSFSIQKGPALKVDVATGLPANVGGLVSTLFGNLVDIPDDVSNIDEMSDLSTLAQTALTAFANSQSPSLPLTSAAEIQAALTAFKAGELYVESDLSTIHNVHVSTLQIGSANASAFVGLNGPYWTDLDKDGQISWAQPDGTTLTNSDGTAKSTVTVSGVQYGDLDGDGLVGTNESAELNEDAVGLEVSNVDFGFVLMTPTLTALPGFSKVLPKMHALKGTANSASLVGMEEVLDASLTNVLVEVNDGTKWPGNLGPARVNFQKSFGTDERLSVFDADDDGITVGELRKLNGKQSDAPGTGQDYTGLYSTTDAASKVVTLAEIISVLDTNKDQILSVSEAQALVDTDADVVAADADGDDKLDPPGFEIRTGTSTAPVYLDYDGSRRLAAAADEVLLQQGDFVHVSGSFSIQKGPALKLDVATGLPGNLGDIAKPVFDIFEPLGFGDGTNGNLQISEDLSTIYNMHVTTLQIGSANASAFVGLNGPYWTDLDRSGDISWSFSTGNGDATSRTISDGSVVIDGTTYSSTGTNTVLPKDIVVTLGKDETVTVNSVKYGDANTDDQVDVDETGELDADAIGLEVSNVDFGFALMTPTAAALPGFDKILPKMHALKGTAESASLVGAEGILDASLKNVLIEVNDGTKWPGDFGPARVNFKSSFGTDERLSVFDFEGNGITVGELRVLNGNTASSSTSYTSLYTTTDAASKVVTLAEIISVLDTNKDQILSVTEALALVDDNTAVSAADVDKDGKLDPPGFEVRTGTSTAPVYLDYDGSRRIGAAADEVLLQMADFVHVSGSFSFQQGPATRVDVATKLPSALADILSVAGAAFKNVVENAPIEDGVGGSVDESTDLHFTSDFSTIRNLHVTTLQIGASNVSAFVGVDGPYWTDIDRSGDVSWALPELTDGDDADTYVDVVYVSSTNGGTGTAYGDIDQDRVVDANETADPTGATWTLPVLTDGNDADTAIDVVYLSSTNGGSGTPYGDINKDGIVDANETAELSSESAGVAITNLDVGFLMATPTLAAIPGFKDILPKFYALKATADQAAFVGIDELVMSLTGIEVNVNDGKAWPGGLGPPVIDFQSSFGTHEQKSLFDADGNGAITVGDLRTLSGLTSYTTLYASGDSAAKVVTLDRVVAVLDTNSDQILTVIEAKAFLSASKDSKADTADADKDGKLEPPGFEIRTGTSTAPVYLDYDGNQRIGASVEVANLQLSDFVHITGSVAFEKGPVQTVAVTGGLLSGLTSEATSLLSSLGLPTSNFLTSIPAGGATTTELSFMTVGASNVHAFIGMDGPYWQADIDSDRRISWSFNTGNGNNASRTITATQNTDPLIKLDGVDYTAALNNILPANKAVSLDAADGWIQVGTVKYGDIDDDDVVDANETAELSEKAAGIVVNNFDLGLSIMTPTNPLDFAKYFALRATAQQVALVGIDNVTLEATHLLVEVNQSSPSIYGLPLFPVVDFANTPKWVDEEVALFDTNSDGKITLGELATLNNALSTKFAALNGIATTDTTLVDHEMLLDILNTNNLDASQDVIDIAEAAALLGGTTAAVTVAIEADLDGDGKIDPLGLEIDTGGKPVYLNMDSPLIRAQGFIHLNLMNAVYLSGSLAFELGPTETVTLSDGSTTREVTTMTIGGANISAFIGVNGPYWTDTNKNHEVDTGELNSSSKGLHITDLDFGIMLMASTKPSELGVFLAAKASVHSFGVVGLDYFKATGTFDIALNVGLGVTGLDVVDFKASFPDTDGSGTDKAGFEVNTGDPTSPVLLDFTDFLIRIQIGGSLTVHSGSPATSSNAILKFSGVFLFELDTTGLRIFVAAGLQFGPDIGKSSGDQFFKLNALGALVINSQGIAADIDVSFAV